MQVPAHSTSKCNAGILHQSMVLVLLLSCQAGSLLTHLGKQWKMEQVLGRVSMRETRRKLLAPGFGLTYSQPLRSFRGVKQLMNLSLPLLSANVPFK